MFTDSIEDNMNLTRELLGNLTPAQKERAKWVAKKIVDTIDAVAKDNAKDGAAGIGVMFAVMYAAENMTKNSSVREDGPRIQLLS